MLKVGDIVEIGHYIGRIVDDSGGSFTSYYIDWLKKDDFGYESLDTATRMDMFEKDFGTVNLCEFAKDISNRIPGIEYKGLCCADSPDFWTLEDVERFLSVIESYLLCKEIILNKRKKL